MMGVFISFVDWGFKGDGDISVKMRRSHAHVGKIISNEKDVQKFKIKIKYYISDAAIVVD